MIYNGRKILKKTLLILIGLAVLLFTMGCHKSVQTFSEDESIIYLLNMLKNLDVDIPKKWSDLLPDVEDIIIEYAKNQTFEDAYKVIIGDGNGVEYDNAASFAINVGSLFSICEGKTTLYRDDELIYEFITDEKHNSYLLLSQKISDNILAMKYVKNRINKLYLRDSIIYADFYLDPANLENIIEDQDIYKYLELRVILKEKER